ncbi:hypothetical protein Lser_V15G12204 [Lactuca serriola]
MRRSTNRSVDFLITKSLLFFRCRRSTFVKWSAGDTCKVRQRNSTVAFWVFFGSCFTDFRLLPPLITDLDEREMEIGYPTDVKHAAHIGWDGSSSSAPSWMNEFKTTPNFAATAIGNSASGLSAWSSQGSKIWKESTPKTSKKPPLFLVPDL